MYQSFVIGTGYLFINTCGREPNTKPDKLMEDYNILKRDAWTLDMQKYRIGLIL